MQRLRRLNSEMTSRQAGGPGRAELLYPQKNPAMLGSCTTVPAAAVQPPGWCLPVSWQIARAHCRHLLHCSCGPSSVAAMHLDTHHFSLQRQQTGHCSPIGQAHCSTSKASTRLPEACHVHAHPSCLCPVRTLLAACLLLVMSCASARSSGCRGESLASATAAYRRGSPSRRQSLGSPRWPDVSFKAAGCAWDANP